MYVADTDNDGEGDGEEVFKGVDPLVPGKVLLLKRAANNMTIEYFIWMAKKTNNPNPPLEQARIDEFVAQKTKTPIQLPQIGKDEIILSGQNNSQGVQEYLSRVNEVPLAFPETNYLKIAADVFNGVTSTLQATLGQLAATYNSYRSIPVPQQALSLHQSYLSLFKFLQTMFKDLYRAKEDPVRIVYNSKRGEELIPIIQNLEQQKQALRRE